MTVPISEALLRLARGCFGSVQQQNTEVYVNDSFPMLSGLPKAGAPPNCPGVAVGGHVLVLIASAPEYRLEKIACYVGQVPAIPCFIQNGRELSPSEQSEEAGCR